jgi:predicted ATP-binding protein involved in virulence
MVSRKDGNHAERSEQRFSFHPGYTTIITGIPGHGKSELLDQMLLQISIDYNLKGGFFTPETGPLNCTS